MSTGSKKALILLLVAIPTMACLIGYILKKAAPPAEIHTVRVFESARSPYFLPQYLALNLGFFKEQNLAVKITTTSPAAIRAALTDGRVDIALCGLQKIIFNPNAGEPQPKIFAAMASQDGSFLLTRKDAENFQWKKIKGKTIIGYSQDDSSEIALEHALKQRGLRPYREVTIYNNIPDTLRLGAFRAGTGNYIQLLEPDATIAELKGYGRPVASVGKAAGNMVVTAYAALPDYIEANPEVIQHFTNAIYKAQLWLLYHSAEEAAEAVAPSFPGTNREVLIRSIERYRKLKIWNEDPQVLRDSFERFCAAAKEAGEIASPASYETTVQKCFAEQAVKTLEYTPKKENLVFKILKRLTNRR